MDFREGLASVRPAEGLSSFQQLARRRHTRPPSRSLGCITRDFFSPNDVLLQGRKILIELMQIVTSPRKFLSCKSAAFTPGQVLACFYPLSGKIPIILLSGEITLFSLIKTTSDFPRRVCTVAPLIILEVSFTGLDYKTLTRADLLRGKPGGGRRGRVRREPALRGRPPRLARAPPRDSRRQTLLFSAGVQRGKRTRL